MGRPPGLIFVARHGARLDAADPQWHLTSPTPYDPPLTYGGWKQAQALGARIANIIRAREESDNASGEVPYTQRRRRKHRVLIHSSPFLRCVQTSVGIAAGLESWEHQLDVDARHNHYHALRRQLHSGSPQVRPLDERRGSGQLSAIPEPADSNLELSKTVTAPHASSHEEDARTMLRLDAFLGEWLSPDYFENITPPPGSKMMIAGAKADLLRRGDPLDPGSNDTQHRDKISGNFPGGWRRNRSPEKENAEEAVGSESHDFGESPPKLGRANTFSAGRTNLRVAQAVTYQTSREKPAISTSAGYVPPTPVYAISPAQPIPQGYVSHARDACLQVDYQWDSMRPPLDWGSGGEYGEEWSSMHRRFRRGLQEMIAYYRRHESDGAKSNGQTDADQTDTVLVLVTHGAGCNALIGALTSQPVLIDVGMASLTMAVRKNVDYTRIPSSNSPLSLSPTWHRRTSLEAGPSVDYDIKFAASTDHLRPGSPYLGGLGLRARSDSVPAREKSPYRYERHISPTSAASGHHDRNHHHNHPPSSLKRQQRPADIETNTSPTTDTSLLSSNSNSPATDTRRTEGSFEEDLVTSSNGHNNASSAPAQVTAGKAQPQTQGLWKKPAPAVTPTDTHSPSPSPLLQTFPEEIPSPKSPTNVLASPLSPSKVTAAVLDATTTTSAFMQNHGLWTAEPRALATLRDQSMPKRRWTVAERSGA